MIGTKSEQLADKLEDSAGGSIVPPTDVRDREPVESLLDEAMETFDGLDIVVNNTRVGRWEREGIVDGNLAAWATEIEVNLLGPMAGTQLAAAVTQEQGERDIVDVGSAFGRFPFPQWPSYVASKQGVRGSTGSALRDLREDSIRVTRVLPGEDPTSIQPDEDIESTRMVEPEDVTEAVSFAVSRPDDLCVNELITVPPGRQ